MAILLFCYRRIHISPVLLLTKSTLTSADITETINLLIFQIDKLCDSALQWLDKDTQENILKVEHICIGL